MPRGSDRKREREYEALKQDFKRTGRYRGREEEVAARIVNKQRQQYGETREDLEKDREGQSPDRGLPIDDYERLTIPEITPQLDHLKPRQLAAIKKYEQQHKDRKGVLHALDRRLKAA